MIKFVAAAIWICAATLGAVFFSFQTASTKADAAGGAPETMMGGLDYVKTDVISVPLIHDSKIDGYFLARLVYTVDPKEMKKLVVPAPSIITDVVYSYVYTNPGLDFSRTAALDLDGFRNSIRDLINKRVQYDLVKDVLVEQIDYLSKDEIRDNAIRRRTATSKVPVMKGNGEGGGATEAKPEGEAAKH